MKKIFLLSIILLAVSCVETGRLDQVDNSDYVPMQVTVKSVQPISGGAIIKYSLPDDINLRGVRAEYVRGGNTVFSEASIFVDSLKIEGFADTQSHTVKLYSFGRNERSSEPVPVDFVPEPSATTKLHFNMADAFGGIRLEMDGNEDRASLAITIIQDSNLDDFGKDPSEMNWEEVFTYYTSGPDASFTRYGLDTLTRIYGVYARDRFLNYSDTTYFKLTPLDEQYLDNKQWRIYPLPGDETKCLQDMYKFEYLFDGKWIENRECGAVTYGGLRRTLTIDMGYTASLSRMRMYPRNRNTMRSNWTPWKWQIWGSTDPNPDGSFDDSWYLLGDFEQYKPSGFAADGTIGTITTEDEDYFFNNNDYSFVETDEIPYPQKPTRYFRIVFLKNYTYYFLGEPEQEPTDVFYLVGEIMMWGKKR